MNLAILKKFPRLSSRLHNYIGYLGDATYKLDGDAFVPCDESPKVIIVARRYYQEHIQTYPSISKAELNQLLKLQEELASGYPRLINVTKNQQQDGFDVKTIEFDIKLIELIGEKKILIPETALIRNEESEAVLYDLETPLGKLFHASIFGKMSSAYARGVVNNIEAFGLSAGSPLSTPVNEIKKSDYGKFLFERLFSAELAQLVKICSFNPSKMIKVDQLHWLYGAPLASALLFVLASTLYYQVGIYRADNRLSEYGSEVEQLLSLKQSQDENIALVTMLNEQLQGNERVHHEWDIVYEAAKKGMFVQQVRKRDGSMLIRGKAKDASKILEAVNKNTLVESAIFSGVVRKSRGEDMFIIKVEMHKAS